MKYLRVTGKINKLSVSLNAFVKTRWNTVCDMFATFIDAYEEIRALLNGRDDLINRYNRINIDTVTEVKEFLDLFKKISDELQSDKVVTSVKILPAFEMLVEHVKIQTNDSVIIRKMKNRATEYIDENKADVLPKNYELWTFFHPGFKHFQGFKTVDISIVMQTLELSISIMQSPGAIGNMTDENENIDELSNRSANDSEKRKRKSSVFNKLQDTVESTGNLSNEIERYLNCSHGTVNNLLEWWNLHKDVYPQLYKYFMEFAAIPATSASAERIFSSAGNIITQRRNRLTPQNVNQLLFLHKNKKN